MPFANLDDEYADSPSNWDLSDAAFRLQTAAILHCSRHTTDGFVRASQVSKLVPRFRKGTVAELLKAGKWKPVELDGTTVSYEVVNYLKWNLSAAQIDERRKQAAARKAAWIARQRNGDHDRDEERV